MKRITIFAGHYGSGKTTIAVNYALRLKEMRQNVAIVDLDIVNPYFRTMNAGDILEKNGIRLISSQYANTNVEMPSIPPQARAVFDDRSISAVIDLGGDDRGALALGRYAGLLKEENDYDMLMVVNIYRPLTRDANGLNAVRREIEDAAGLAFTGLVNNSNIGRETVAGDITASYNAVGELADKTGLEVKMICARRDLCAGLAESKAAYCDLFPVDIFGKQAWKI